MSLFSLINNVLKNVQFAFLDFSGTHETPEVDECKTLGRKRLVVDFSFEKKRQKITPTHSRTRKELRTAKKDCVNLQRQVWRLQKQIKRLKSNSGESPKWAQGDISSTIKYILVSSNDVSKAKEQMDGWQHRVPNIMNAHSIMVQGPYLYTRDRLQELLLRFYDKQIHRKLRWAGENNSQTANDWYARRSWPKEPRSRTQVDSWEKEEIIH